MIKEENYNKFDPIGSGRPTAAQNVTMNLGGNSNSSSSSHLTGNSNTASSSYLIGNSNTASSRFIYLNNNI